MRDKLISFLEKEITKIDIDKLLEVPKIEAQGDFALPMFSLAKELKKAPIEIAKEYQEKLSKKLPEFLSKVVAIGPYLNFYLNSEIISKQILDGVIKGNLFKIKTQNPQKILIEYPSPNTNKALHIGHVRNICLGNSLSKIFSKVGHKIVKVNMNNDRGIAICKSMLGYKLYFSNQTPKNLNLKSDEFVSRCYVKFEEESKKDEKLLTVAQDMLVKWEDNDKETRDLWEKVMGFVFEGYAISYKNFKLDKYDRQYYESQIYNNGKEIVLDALKNNVKGFGSEDDGAIFCDLSDIKLDKKYLLRGDGTTLYMTQDIYLAFLKDKEFNIDKSIFIVGRDQEYHFKVLFEILDRIGFGGTNKNYHFSYGYVFNKDGKKFSSRKGEVVGADWMLEQVVEKAKENLLSRENSNSLSNDDIEKRAKIIGYGALAFFIIKVNPLDDIKFDVEKSLSFEGESGPYVQYTYARIKSVLRKASYKKVGKVNYSLFGEKEVSLIKALGEFDQVVLEAAQKYKPSLVANYLIKICQLYNEFYQNCQILKEKEDLRDARLLLCDATSRTIKEGLELLDIETLEEM